MVSKKKGPAVANGRTGAAANGRTAVAAKPQSLSAQVRDRLGRDIVSGVVGEGQSLPPEPMLGESFGVSRTVVREAVKALIAKGLVVSGPKLGTRVLPRDQWNWFDADIVRWSAATGLSTQLLRDLHELRRVVEPLAVRLAAERATPSDVTTMANALAAMTVAANAEDGEAYVKHDLQFHQALLKASHNQMITQVGKALGPLLAVSFDISSDHAKGAVNSLPMHAQVLDAVQRGRADRAARASLALIDDAGRDIDRLRMGAAKKVAR